MTNSREPVDCRRLYRKDLCMPQQCLSECFEYRSSSNAIAEDPSWGLAEMDLTGECTTAKAVNDDNIKLDANLIASDSYKQCIAAGGCEPECLEQAIKANDQALAIAKDENRMEDVCKKMPKNDKECLKYFKEKEKRERSSPEYFIKVL